MATLDMTAPVTEPRLLIYARFESTPYLPYDVATPPRHA